MRTMAAALLAALGVAGAGAGPVAGMLFLFDEAGGVLVEPVQLPPLSSDTLACGGFAPEPPFSCRTGPWNLGEFTKGFFVPECGTTHPDTVPEGLGRCFAGSIRSEISDGATTRGQGCNILYFGDTRLDYSCFPIGDGTNPTEPFYHTCAVGHYGTRVAGGLGDWACFVNVVG
jgi:hypothetical protein